MITIHFIEFIIRDIFLYFLLKLIVLQQHDVTLIVQVIKMDVINTSINTYSSENIWLDIYISIKFKSNLMRKKHNYVDMIFCN